MLPVGERVLDFKSPPHPKGIDLSGQHIEIIQLDAARHAASLYEAKRQDKEEVNWLYLPYGPFADLPSYQGWLEEMADLNDPAFFTLIRKSDQRAVGIASYLRIDQHNGSIEVGHIHFSPLLQNTTAATEALYLMMKWAFEAGYRRFEWKCNALNLKSRKAAQRLGLSYEGIFRQMMIAKGRNRDTAWYAAIDKEWPALKQAFETYLDDDNFDKDGMPRQSLTTMTKPLLHKIDDALSA